MSDTILKCGDGCVFCVKTYIISKHIDGRIFEKNKCLLGHGRGNFVNLNDFCSWASTDEDLLKSINEIVNMNGAVTIGNNNHYSSLRERQE